MLSQRKGAVIHKLNDRETMQERGQSNTQGEGKEEGCWLYIRSRERTVQILNELWGRGRGGRMPSEHSKIWIY